MSGVQRYRLKPVIVEAARIEDSNAIEDIWYWITTSGGKASVISSLFGEEHHQFIELNTGKGSSLRAVIGDYVIRTSDGKFTVMPPNLFELHYERNAA